MQRQPFHPEDLLLLVCPACHGSLVLQQEMILCVKCGERYPLVDGIPVLIRAPAQNV